MKKHMRFALVALFGLLAGVAVVQMKNQSAPTGSALSQPVEVSTAQLAHSTSGQSTSPDIAAPQARSSAARPFSASVAEALPKLAQPVKNWREFKPQKLVVAPYPDTPMEFEQTSVREENGRTIWNGRNALTGAFLVLVSTENAWHAVLEIPLADSFELQLAGEKLTVVQTSGAGGCGADQLKLRQKAAHSADIATEPAASDTPVVPKPADAYTYVDVVFFYDAVTLSTAGSISAIETAAIARIASANGALANSAIANLRWRYVATYPIPAYTTPTDIEVDLDRISDIQQSIDVIDDSTQRNFVTARLTDHGADQALLYITGTRTDSGNTIGLAWSPRTVTGNISRGAARAVVMWRRTSDGATTGFKTLAHELAHNFACQHDRGTEAQSTDNPEGAYDGDGKYWYGHKLTYNGVVYGTIMSYVDTDPQRIAFFSNPDVLYNLVPTGVPTAQPKAAHNAKVLTDKATGMSTVTGRTFLPPVINTQPQSVTINVGASFSFSVVAQGAITGYQWQKAGAPIGGASTSSYTVASAVAADADSYNVVITNDAGSTTSSTVTVTLNSSSSSSSSSSSGSPPPAPAPSPSGSGGSGGAMPVWVLVALSLAGVGRLLSRRA